MYANVPCYFASGETVLQEPETRVSETVSGCCAIVLTCGTNLYGSWSATRLIRVVQLVISGLSLQLTHFHTYKTRTGDGARRSHQDWDKWKTRLTGADKCPKEISCIVRHFKVQRIFGRSTKTNVNPFNPSALCFVMHGGSWKWPIFSFLHARQRRNFSFLLFLSKIPLRYDILITTGFVLYPLFVCLPLYLETMSTNEATPLLGKPASDPAKHPLDGCAENEPPTAQTGNRFALWQIAAFFGKNWFWLGLFSCGNCCGWWCVLGIMLARADTSLVWATHETVASHFDNLDNSSWMMTSFAIGCCVTYPLVCLSPSSGECFDLFTHASNSTGV